MPPKTLTRARPIRWIQNSISEINLLQKGEGQISSSRPNVYFSDKSWKVRRYMDEEESKWQYQMRNGTHRS